MCWQSTEEKCLRPLRSAKKSWVALDRLALASFNWCVLVYWFVFEDVLQSAIYFLENDINRYRTAEKRRAADLFFSPCRVTNHRQLNPQPWLLAVIKELWVLDGWGSAREQIAIILRLRVIFVWFPAIHNIIVPLPSESSPKISWCQPSGILIVRAWNIDKWTMKKQNIFLSQNNH